MSSRNGNSEPKNNLRIGELAESLKKEFFDVSVSKLRYFEEKGLINPKRDSSGYRRYSKDDYNKLKKILSAQRDRYLPLEVINREIQSGLFVQKSPRSKKLFINKKVAQNSMGEKDLLKLSGITNAQLKDLKNCGILISDSGYTEDDLEVINAVKPLFANGIEARHIKPFKRSAEQEADLVMQITAPLFNKVKEKEAYLKLDELVKAGIALRQALLKIELHTGLK